MCSWAFEGLRLSGGLCLKCSPQVQTQHYFKQPIANLPLIYFHRVPNGNGCTFTSTFILRAITTFIYGKPSSSDTINTYIHPETELLAAKALWVMILMAPALLEAKLVLLELNVQEQKPLSETPRIWTILQCVSNYFDSEYLIWVAGVLTN